jgi:methylmalonyl-CoA mutase
MEVETPPPHVPLRDPSQASFVSSNKADWRVLAEGELKGQPFDKKLLTKTYEGLVLQPLYTAEDIGSLDASKSFPGFFPYTRGKEPSGRTQRPWKIFHDFTSLGPVEFNRQARAALQRGLDGLVISIDDDTLAGRDSATVPSDIASHHGLPISTKEDLRVLLDGVDLSTTPLLLSAGPLSAVMFGFLVALFDDQKADLGKLSGFFDNDHLAHWAAKGSLPTNLSELYDGLAVLIERTHARCPNFQPMGVSTRVWHEAGGDAAQELGLSLAAGVEYLRALSERGIPLDVAANKIRFQLTLGTQFFKEMAKVRAARWIWARLFESLGIGDTAKTVSIHARTSFWNKTHYEPTVNILRSTVEAFAAVLGGCDSLEVAPYNGVSGVTDELSHRLARNTQVVLKEECDLTQVTDPAGGSYYVEHLTHALAEKAWGIFQDVEKRGGLASALRQGVPQEWILRTAREKQKNISRRRDVFVGINQYASINAKGEPPHTGWDRWASQVEAVNRYRTVHHSTRANLARPAEGGRVLVDWVLESIHDGASLGDLAHALWKDTEPEPVLSPLPLERGPSRYEALRRRIDLFTQKHNVRPAVYLAVMGPIKQHKARADFSRSFFETAGFQVVYPAPGFSQPDQAAHAALTSHAPVTVLCSTDDTYPALVPAFVAGLKKRAKHPLLVLAGLPEGQEDVLRQAGVDEFIHVRVDALETLERIAQKAGLLS